MAAARASGQSRKRRPPLTHVVSLFSPWLAQGKEESWLLKSLSAEIMKVSKAVGVMPFLPVGCLAGSPVENRLAGS